MAYQLIRSFITEKMSMSHIYQPLMLIELLKEMDGKASVKDIAQAILNKDPTQIALLALIASHLSLSD